MIYFYNKNSNLVIVLSVLEWKMLVHFLFVWNILRPFDIFYGHLVQLGLML
jgi:hypothetical protein